MCSVFELVLETKLNGKSGRVRTRRLCDGKERVVRS